MEFYPTKKCSLDPASHETRVVTNLKGKTESAIALPFIEPHQASFLSETTNNSVTLQEAGMCVCQGLLHPRGWAPLGSPALSPLIHKQEGLAKLSLPRLISFFHVMVCPGGAWMQIGCLFLTRFLFPHSLPYLILLPSFLLFSFPLLLCTHPFYFHFLSPLSSSAYFLPTLLTL